MAIQKVTLIGANGKLGPAILHAPPFGRNFHRDCSFAHVI
jgi:hypothetical protein